jgi:hypothetical protein
MTIQDLMSLIRELVPAGKVKFRLRHVNTVRGYKKGWIETEGGLSPWSIKLKMG